ncbi:unnamed protein product, partial [Ectocarpus sp. 13 AM-2016]
DTRRRRTTRSRAGWTSTGPVRRSSVTTLGTPSRSCPRPGRDPS